MPNTQGRRVRGNLVYIDQGGGLRRVVDAIGPDVLKYIAEPSHFQANAATASDPSRFTVTVVEAGSGTSEMDASNGAGQTFRIITAADENDGLSAQLNGESFELTSDQDLYFGIELSLNDATQTDYFVGLAITDTAILGGVTDRIGFEKLDGSTDVGFMVEKDSTETKSSAQGTAADDTFMVLEFYWAGADSALYVFIDGTEVTAPATTNLPNDEALRLSLELLTGEAVANNMTVKWLRVIQIGR